MCGDRNLYGPFECTKTMRSGNADVYKHKIPGGQYKKLPLQAYSLGLGDQFEVIKKKYTEANNLLGNLVKVGGTTFDNAVVRSWLLLFALQNPSSFR